MFPKFLNQGLGDLNLVKIQHSYKMFFVCGFLKKNQKNKRFFNETSNNHRFEISSLTISLIFCKLKFQVKSNSFIFENRQSRSIYPTPTW
jgi:hypothetical protein